MISIMEANCEEAESLKKLLDKERKIFSEVSYLDLLAY